MNKHTGILALSALVLALSTGAALALMPLPRPQGAPGIDAGLSASYAGAWSITLPTMEMGEPDTNLAICKLPVRIEAADETHIFYLGPSETETEAAIELIARDDGAAWEPIAGGPAFFALWVDADSFYLYEAAVEGEQDWGRPYIYNRCPS